MKIVISIAIISIVLGGFLLLSIVGTYHNAYGSIVAKRARIETQIPLGKIVCTKKTDDGCLEYVIYKTVKE